MKTKIVISLVILILLIAILFTATSASNSPECRPYLITAHNLPPLRSHICPWCHDGFLVLQKKSRCPWKSVSSRGVYYREVSLRYDCEYCNYLFIDHWTQEKDM